MEPQTQKIKTTAFDFFLHLGVIVSLYTAVGFLLNLLFSVINSAYPQIGGYYYGTSISLQVAALVVLTPVFLVLAYLVAKGEALDPDKKTLWIKRWSTYLTMFISGAIIMGDLITLIYYFLDGRDLTMAFLLKVLSVFVVLGALFGYYLSNLRSNLSTNARNLWRVFAILIVLVSIILGFTVIGSPRMQRQMRYDQQRVSDLQNIQNQVVSYWQSKATLPANLLAMKDSLSYFGIPTDPQTKAQYTYNVNTKTAFELCATFNLDARDYQNTKGYSGVNYYGDPNNENWSYKKGEYCFQRTIDPQRYPVMTVPGAPKPVY
jgi:type II secretory pathway pseudopilin PulG